MTWRGKTVLVTGATGIVGSWLCRRLVDLRADWQGQHHPVGRGLDDLHAEQIVDVLALGHAFEVHGAIVGATVASHL